MSRGGSFCATLSSMIYCVAFFIFNFIIYKRYTEAGYTSESIMVVYYFMFALLLMTFIASMLAICGILNNDSRDSCSRMLLIPFIACMSMYVAILIVQFILVILIMKIPLYMVFVGVIHIGFCLLMDLCVICHYNIYGRGTNRSTNITGEPPAMYIAVSERMTLPFSREGGDGAAMYTSRVPSPEINFPINSIGGGVENYEEQESDPLTIAPSAPSDSGSLLPVGRALPYPFTSANNTPYLSGTINRRPTVETRNSSRSLSHLEVACNNQQTTEPFGVKRMTSPPQYHILSTKEKVESIV